MGNRMGRRIGRVAPKIGTCDYCASTARVKHECRTCEKIRERKPEHETFAVQACRQHAEQAYADIKKHALTKHPTNLLGAIAAQLKGEGVIE